MKFKQSDPSSRHSDHGRASRRSRGRTAEHRHLLRVRRVYRYNRGGNYYETNQYGADLLGQAVNSGYQEGFRAGDADRQDRWHSDYRNSYAYRDANYGYSGYYLAQADYNYYFREGFQCGYEDGFSSRYQFGRYSEGRYSILGEIFSQILNFQSIR